MKDLEWFPPIPEPRVSSAPRVLWPAVTGVFLGGLLFMRGHRLAAMAVWAAASVIVVGLASAVLRRPILRAFRGLGVAAGRITTWLVLFPFYVLGVGTIRLALAAARIDLLGLRLHRDWPTYWQLPASEGKRAKYYARLFTVEPPRRQSHYLATATGVLAFVLALAGSSELILRAMGFGNPIVYRVDPRVGYYSAPRQDVHRYGGEIHINAFGMRSHDVTAAKPAGTFRILMLGDSTLYGGSYIDQRQIYAARLESLLDRSAGGLPNSPRHVEVLCMGVNAWGPQHELAYVQEFGFFQADLVMVMGPPDDAYRPRYGIQNLPFYREGHRPQWAWREFWDHLGWEYNLRSAKAADHASTSRQVDNVLADGVEAWLGIASLAQRQGARVDFEFLPHEEEVRRGRASESTQQVLDAVLPDLARKRVPSAYPLAFFERNLGVADLYHDGVHLDAPGHKIYALYLRDRVLELAAAK